MAATSFICGSRRLLATLVATGAIALVFATTALASSADRCDNAGSGKHNGYECEVPVAPAPPPPPAPAPADPPPTEPSPAEPPAAPADAPAADAPAADAPSAEAPPAEAEVPPAEAPPVETPAVPETAPSQPEPVAPVAGDPPAPAPPAPAPPADEPPVAAPPVIDGWGPVRRPDPPARTEPNARASSPRASAAAAPPDASWNNRRTEASRTDASWTDAQLAQYGVTGTGAVITIRRRHGIFGGLSFRIEAAAGRDVFVFRAARSIVAGSGGRLYRIGTWLRTEAPGLTVCLRIQEVTERDPLTAVRTSESCLAPTAKWRHFELYRRTLARGNKLVFSLYAFGAVAGDSFEVNRFSVHRRVGKRAWQRVAAAFGDAL